MRQTPRVYRIVPKVISIHAPHEGVRRSRLETVNRNALFQSTHPARGCDPMRHIITRCVPISIHAPREGVRHVPRSGYSYGCPFQSTHPARGCDFLKNFSDFHAQISIHAPREGVRRVPENVIILPLRISIHAPREGVRRGRHKCKRVIFHFNPRTPRGGATWPAQMQARDFPFQSTHPARGCDLSCCSICGLCVISIHAPREGVRQQNCVKTDTIAQFCELSGNDTSRNLRFCSL